MSSLRQKGAVPRTAWFLFLVICMAQTLARPGVAMQGAAHGMQLCCETVIPSLFPFLVLCELLLQSPLAAFFGIPFVPLARALGIRSRRAPAALFCGLLGGFASAARSVDRMYRESEISQREASVLLVCCVGSSPAFIIGSAGYAMLGSVKAGWFLLAGQFTASLICGFAAARLTPAGKRISPCRPAPPEKGVAAAVRGAVFSMAILCGYIILFSFLGTLFTPNTASPLRQYAINLPLEVTAACQKASTCAPVYRAPLCMAALSLMGACVFLQVRALTHPDISLVPLALSRIAHLPLSLAVLTVLMRLFPVIQPAAAWEEAVLVSRMPADAVCAVFCMCALAICPRRSSHA